MDTAMNELAVGTRYLLRVTDLPGFKPCVVTDVRCKNGMVYLNQVGERHSITPERFVALPKSKELIFTATCHLYLEEYTEELKSEPYSTSIQ